MANGKYIVVEGISGVGKSVIIERLARELQAAQIPVRIVTDKNQSPDMTAQIIQRIIDDPRYPVNNRAEVLLYNAARAQALNDIQRAVNAGIVCLADQSYLTTLVTEYYGRGDITDYAAASQIVQYAAGQRQPDLLLLLDAPVSTIKGRLGADRQAGFDEAYHERIRAGYLWEAKQHNLPVVYATDPIDTVLTAAWKLVSNAVGVHVQSKPAGATSLQSVAEVLAANPPVKATPVEPPVATAEPWATDASAEPGFAKYVTTTSGSVYSFTDAVSAATVATAMARSAHGDDLRAVVFDELTSEGTPPLEQAIAAYGKDRVSQFAGQCIVVENASQLLMQKIEQDRAAAYLSPTMRQTDFSQKDSNGHYRYIIPENLKGKPRSAYIRVLNQIFDIYAKLVASTTAHIRAVSTTPAKAQDAAWRSATRTQAIETLRVLLPVAAGGSIGVYASGEALKSLVTRLLSDELPEVRTTGKRIAEEVRKTDVAALLGSANRPDYDTTVRNLALELLPPSYTAEAQPVTLAAYTPHNELDIVADILYTHSDSPLQKIQQEVSGWPYQRKVDVLSAYVSEALNSGREPGRALEKVHYSFDLICAYDTFRELQQRRIVDSMERQILSPRLGYDVPQLIEEAGGSEAFEQCFDLSLQLYSDLQTAGFSMEAQYATLLGHKLRGKLACTAREAFRLRPSPDRQSSSDCRQLIRQMHAKVAEVHPLIAGAIRDAGADKAAERTAGLTTGSTPRLR